VFRILNFYKKNGSPISGEPFYLLPRKPVVIVIEIKDSRQNNKKKNNHDEYDKEKFYPIKEQ
jgi:hypothetical protein